MATLITGLRADDVRARVRRVHEEIAQAGREPGSVALLAAVKYVALEELPVLAQAGIELVGENRAQALEAKARAHPGLFSWDFIGHLQSRKVRSILPLVRYIHSVASDSALEQLGRHGGADARVLIEVNVAGEAGKSGVAPAQLADVLARCPVAVVGLMTMPPQTGDPEASRPHFAALAALADEHGLRELSMGTSQDYRVAVQEGATIIRLGSTLYAD